MPSKGEGLEVIGAFFSSGWVVWTLVAATFAGLMVSLSKPKLLPPTTFFAGVWYTKLLWMLLALSLGTLLLRGLQGAMQLVKERGAGWAIYRLLTSVRLAIVLTLLFVAIGLIGTIVPQLSFNRRIDLIARYGHEDFSLLERLGFFTVFSSWYTYAVVVLFVANLSMCTQKRLRASLSYARLPMRPKLPKALARMPYYYKLSFRPEAEGILREKVRMALSRWRFRVREDGGQLLAERYRWERFAIDVFHISLLIAIGALIITNTLGYNYLKISYKGDVFSVPGRSFQVRVDDFWSENYPGSERVMDWKTKLTILEDGREVRAGITEVNHPFTYKGVSIYQAAMGEDWLGGARLMLRVERADGSNLGEYRASVGESFEIPEEGIVVMVGAFLPDFALEGDVAYSRTQRLLNPAAYLEIYDRSGGLLFRTWTFAQLPQMQLLIENPYRFYLEGMTAPQFTGLEISWDPGVPVAYGAFALMVVMLVAHILFKHQMVWVHIDAEAGLMRLGGRSRKGEFTAFERLIDDLLEDPEVQALLRTAFAAGSKAAHSADEHVAASPLKGATR